MVNPGDNAQITREDVYKLEQREKELRIGSHISYELTPSSSGDHPTVASLAETENLSRSTEKPPVVEGGGLSFLSVLFTDSKWRDNNADLLQSFGHGTQIVETAVKSNSLPPSQEARVIFDKYLDGSHVQNPFLLRKSVQQLYTRVFLSQAPQNNTRHDMFRTFMILAIGSVTLHRTGNHPFHPFGYYVSAMQHFDSNFLTNGLSSIQDLLLIGRFGIYHHIGTSIWDITQLCMRMCIEHGLHRLPNTKIPLLHEQLQRRIFWECYMIDRYSSGTLDRPMAIADRDIRIGFPANADDEEVVAAQDIFPDLDSFSTAHVAGHLAMRTNEMSVFFVVLRLRQITSRIHSKFSRTSESFLATGKIYTDLNQNLCDLEEWRKSTPVFDNPKCLYQTQEWYDLLYSGEQLILIRKGIELLPKRNGVPPEEILTLCLQFASKTIELYSNLYRQGMITYTRSYFQMLFTAGLSVMFCVSVGTKVTNTISETSLKTLSICEETLKNIGVKLPDAKSYVAVFAALRGNIAKKRDRYLQRSQATSRRSPEIPSTPSGSYHGSIPNVLLSQQQLPLNRENGEGMRNFVAELPNSHFATHQAFESVSDWVHHGDNQAFNHFGTGAELGVDDILPWAFLNEDTLWNMEAGLGDYAYGNPNSHMNLFDGFDFHH
ncbi:fungal-specific transcription factor domain-containing protein [Tricladium varicosporioides]|nr:fungal-specific transcription factor domain-containing protein [Hymenoscyphus varicosporioides]